MLAVIDNSPVRMLIQEARPRDKAALNRSREIQIRQGAASRKAG